MRCSSLTINEVLRYANHDFLNHLNLIKMNLDLGRIEESKKIIDQIAEQCNTLSNLNKLQLSKTVEWLQIFRWRYPALLLTIESNVKNSLQVQKDEQIVEYLEQSVEQIYNQLDPFTEQQLLIQITLTEEEFKLTFDLKGQWDNVVINQNDLPDFFVQTYEQTNRSWKYELTLKEWK